MPFPSWQREWPPAPTHFPSSCAARRIAAHRFWACRSGARCMAAVGPRCGNYDRRGDARRGAGDCAAPSAMHVAVGTARLAPVESMLPSPPNWPRHSSFQTNLAAGRATACGPAAAGAARWAVSYHGVAAESSRAPSGSATKPAVKSWRSSTAIRLPAAARLRRDRRLPCPAFRAFVFW